MANPLLSCDVDGHGPFSTVRGAAYHARWCASYRQLHGIADDAPGVNVSRAADAVTLDSIMAALAAPVPARSAPVADAAAGETVIIDGVAYRKA